MNKEVLYIEIFQPFAQYRNPFTFFFAQTYPLPAISQIVGMLQNITKKYYDSSFYDLNYSIHGYFETGFWNYQQLIKGDISINKNGSILNSKDKNNSNKKWEPLYNTNSVTFRSQRTPINQQELFNGRIFIFIKGEKEKLEDIKISIEKLDKVVYLGRSEDVIYIRQCDFVSPFDIKNKKIIKFNYPCWFELKEDIKIENQIKSPVYFVPIKHEYKLDGKDVKSKGEIIFEKTTRESYFKCLYLSNTKYYKFSKPLKCEMYKINNREFVIPEISWIDPNDISVGD